MDNSVKKRLKKDKQIKKFSAYGFLKNLSFFKPYLLLFLMSKGISLFEIGILYSVRELIVYVFEIPSGLIADYVGRKKELYLCFTFYIISFVFFFLTETFFLSAIAMVFFGLGEAFRSGTHKAMILSYLEKHGLKEYKAFVYGRTRSFSLIGSALNSLLAIVLVLYFSASKYIFLASIIPYIADFILISTYPNYLDKEHDKPSSIRKNNIKKDLGSVFKNTKAREILFHQAIFQGVVKSTKDLIQPGLKTLILSSGLLIHANLSADKNVKILIGLAYFVINLSSSQCSKNAYKLKNFTSVNNLMKASVTVLALVMFLIPLSIKTSSLLFCFLLFFILHIISDLRKPIYIDLIDDYMDKNLRATFLSVESQITAVATVILAPILGYLADIIIK